MSLAISKNKKTKNTVIIRFNTDSSDNTLSTDQNSVSIYTYWKKFIPHQGATNNDKMHYLNRQQNNTRYQKQWQVRKIAKQCDHVKSHSWHGFAWTCAVLYSTLSNFPIVTVTVPLPMLETNNDVNWNEQDNTEIRSQSSQSCEYVDLDYLM